MVIGATALPFVPRDDAMLALQTELHANPDTGANPDMVFERDGQYFKLAKWGRVVLDGNLGWAVALSPSGFKQIEMNSYNFPVTGNQGYTTKYNGAVLPNFSGIPASANLGTISQATGRYYVTIANADSGWGDSYTPTLEEIKAYFMGWTMFDGSAGTGSGNSPDKPANNVYNGTGMMWWARRTDGITRTWADATSIVPTNLAPNWTPYQLLYQLATPVVEPITSEGQLTFNEGDNQVEVGTGIMLRESTKPTLSTLYNTYEINSVNTVGSVAPNPLKYKARKVLTIYKNNRQDKWLRISDTNSYGLERAF